MKAPKPVEPWHEGQLGTAVAMCLILLGFGGCCRLTDRDAKPLIHIEILK